MGQKSGSPVICNNFLYRRGGDILDFKKTTAWAQTLFYNRNRKRGQRSYGYFADSGYGADFVNKYGFEFSYSGTAIFVEIRLRAGYRFYYSKICRVAY